MSFDIGKNKRDRNAEKEGVWMPWVQGSSFLVARNNNPAYKAFISKALRENAAILDSASELDMADQISDEVLLEGVARHLLCDWKGISNNGKAVKYTPELAMQMLEEHDDAARAISAFATNRDNYLVKIDSKDEENLKK